MQTHLVFVYNADSGLFNTITDIAHKVISPTTYSCRLCSLTHSYFAVKKNWTDFLQGLDAELEFLHRDELNVKYGIAGLRLPVILLNRNNRLETWISSDEINACPAIDDLKALISARLHQNR